MAKKEKLLVIGSSSNIFKELKRLLPNSTHVTELTKNKLDMSNLNLIKKKLKFFSEFDKIVFLQGMLIGKRQNIKSTKEIYDQLTVNLLSIIEVCEYLIEFKKNVKIVVIGSESGVKGSFDKTYFLSKSALHHYVKEKKLKFKNQQLVCVSPSTIEDSYMTIRRRDKKKLLDSKRYNRKKRFLKSIEIAKIIYSLFYEITDYVSNCIIHVDGGKFSRMD